MHFKWKSVRYLDCFKFLNHFPAQVLPIQKNHSSLRLLCAEIFPRQFTKFCRTCAILCAPTVACVYRGLIQRKTYDMGSCLVDYNIALCRRQSQLQHIYHGRPYDRVSLNSTPESTLSPSPGLRISPQCVQMTSSCLVSLVPPYI